MVKRIVLSLVAVLCSVSMALAQNKQVAGTVTGSDGAPVIGASVVVVGTTNGTSTGADGKFVLSAPSNGTLEFSFIGYVAQQVAISGKTTVDVVLAEDNTTLDDVVVVAYGAKRKQDIVGSVSTVKADLIENSQASSVSKALEGAVAGLQVLSGSGQPGSDATIVVRGMGSISADNSALIVVDGMPFSGSLSDINPSDIASISVSKDAVSNSLYGARASNGIVFVTTKKGSNERTVVDFKASWGVNQRAYKDYAMATDPQEFYELSWYGIRNTHFASTPADSRSLSASNNYASQNLLRELGDYNAFVIPGGEYLVGVNGKLNPNAVTRYNDSFADAMFDSSLRQDYQASVAGGSEKSDYFISMGYLNDDAYIVGSSYDRFTTRAKVNTKIKDWLKVGTNIAYSRTNSNGVNETEGQASNPFDVARSWAPIYPVYARDAVGNVKRDENGNAIYDDGIAGTTDGAGTRPTATNQNVIANLKENIEHSVSNNLMTRSFLEINFLKNFTFTTNYSYDFSTAYGTSYYIPLIGDGMSFNGRGTKTAQYSSNMNFNQLLMYNFSCNAHSIVAKVGHENSVYKYDGFSGQKTNFFDPENSELVNGGEMQYITSYTQGHNMEGYFAMADYDYDHKYYLSGSVRRDGTSRFLNKWGTFWAVGGAWRISSEKFMENANWVNDLKIRASYGTQGNENMLNYTPYQDLYDVTWDGSAFGYNYSFYGNPDLSWESQKTFDAGVDFRFFDKLYGSVEFYNRVTDDMIFRRALPQSSGRPYNWENIGSMRNTGIEFEINYDIFNRADLRWTVSLVGATNKNTVLELPDEYKENGMTNGSFLVEEGKSFYNYNTYKYAGMTADGAPSWYGYPRVTNPDTGELEVDKSQGLIAVTDYSWAEKQELGKDALASFTGGFNTSFSYKGIDLNVATAFQLGGWAYDSQYLSGLSSSFYVGHSTDLWDSYNPETGKGSIPIWNANTSSNSYTQTSDVHLISASYFSIRNLTLGYSFPKAWMNKMGIGSIRVFVAGDNIALWSKRQGFDPRTSFSGGNGSFGGFAPMRTISGGINLTF